MAGWTGVFPAVTTKLTRDGKVDIPATQTSIDRLLNNGVSGVIVLPMLGENASLNMTEREAVIRAAVEVVNKRAPVLSGLAEITLDKSPVSLDGIVLAADLAESGAISSKQLKQLLDTCFADVTQTRLHVAIETSLEQATEARRRATVIHAYYAVFLECRDALTRWGKPPPPRQTAHSEVRRYFSHARHPDLNAIGTALDTLVRARNTASYDLTQTAPFATVRVAGITIQTATDALALLDAIDADPARRAAAVAALPP